MRGITILGALLLLIGTGFTTQAQTGPGDSTSIKVGDVNIKITEDENGSEVDIDFEEEYDYVDEEFSPEDWFDSDKEYEKFNSEPFLIDFGMNGVLFDGNTQLPVELNEFESLRYPKSYQVNVHIFKHRVSLIQRVINLEYGAGVSFNRFHFKNDVTLVPQLGGDSIQVIDLEMPIKRSKLSVSYFQVPVLLAIETNPDNRQKSFHLAAGGYAGIKLGSRTKYLTETKLKVTQRDNFNLNTWRYGLEGRIGYGRVTFYAQYALSDLFENAATDKASHVSAGIVLHGM